MPPRLKCNSLQLKSAALLLMTLDHTAAVLSCGALYRPMRNLGRIAFPIYCFLLVEGFLRTRSLRRYMGRLVLAAALSELPFALALYGRFPAPRHNVMLTLLLGLGTMLALERGQAALERSEAPPPLWKEQVLYGAVVSAAMGLGFFLRCDYRGGGVLMIALFYLCRGERWALGCLLAPVMLVFYNPYELYGLLALPLIALSGAQRSERRLDRRVQWFFYLYYPLHLTLLLALGLQTGRLSLSWFGSPVP